MILQTLCKSALSELEAAKETCVKVFPEIFLSSYSFEHFFFQFEISKHTNTVDLMSSMNASQVFDAMFG